VFDPSDHASAINAPRIRFETTNIGGSTDKWNFDLVQIAQGQGTPSSVETDPFSIHKDGTTPLTANWNAGAFNITAQDVLVDEIKVSGGFGSTGVTINNGDYWGDGNLYILGNLTAVGITTTIFNGSSIPVPTNTWTLGNSSNVWLSAYATTFYQGGTALNSLFAPISVGNWAGNQSSYSTTAAANLLYAPILATYNNITALQVNISSIGNYSAERATIYSNISNVNSTSVGAVSVNALQYTNITALQTTSGYLVTNNQSMNGTVAAHTTSISYLVTNNQSMNGTVTALIINVTSIGNYSADKTNIYNNITNLNTSKANLASPVFTGSIATPRLNITTAPPFYIWYYNATYFDCVNATGTIYNRGNVSVTCA
jgi:hypothetical protein